MHESKNHCNWTINILFIKSWKESYIAFPEATLDTFKPEEATKVLPAVISEQLFPSWQPPDVLGLKPSKISWQSARMSQMHGTRSWNPELQGSWVRASFQPWKTGLLYSSHFSLSFERLCRRSQRDTEECFGIWGQASPLFVKGKEEVEKLNSLFLKTRPEGAQMAPLPHCSFGIWTLL